MVMNKKQEGPKYPGITFSLNTIEVCGRIAVMKERQVVSQFLYLDMSNMFIKHFFLELYLSKLLILYI